MTYNVLDSTIPVQPDTLVRLKMEPETVRRCIVRALQYFNNGYPFVFLGVLAGELGLSIDKAQIIADLMCELKMIRPATDDELKAKGVKLGSSVYIPLRRAPWDAGSC
jgi:hypothetical protein